MPEATTWRSGRPPSRGLKGRRCTPSPGHEAEGRHYWRRSRSDDHGLLYPQGCERRFLLGAAAGARRRPRLFFRNHRRRWPTTISCGRLERMSHTSLLARTALVGTLASALLLAPLSARADDGQTSVAPGAPATYSFWGSPKERGWKRALFFGEVGVAVVAGAVGLGFNLAGISKENDRQDYISQHGNVDLRSGPGVAEVGPQCRGSAQCAAYTSITSARDRDYTVGIVAYSIGGGALLGAGVLLVDILSSHDRGDRTLGGLKPLVGPNVAGATWGVSF